jgi:hypothetical protein
MRCSLLPRLGELVAVKQPKDAADQEQYDLVERPRNGEQAERATPAQRARDATVADDDLGGADRLGDSGSNAHRPRLPKKNSVTTVRTTITATARAAHLIDVSHHTQTVGACRIRGHHVLELPG